VVSIGDTILIEFTIANMTGLVDREIH
jgi:hypothetical protein